MYILIHFFKFSCKVSAHIDLKILPFNDKSSLNALEKLSQFMKLILSTFWGKRSDGNKMSRVSYIKYIYIKSLSTVVSVIINRCANSKLRVLLLSTFFQTAVLQREAAVLFR